MSKFKVGDEVRRIRDGEEFVISVIVRNRHFLSQGNIERGWVYEYDIDLISDYQSPVEVTDFRSKVQSVLKEIEDLLVEKNESYGNAALKPLAMFSKASAEERLNIAIDNKLNRLYSGKEYGQEDTAVDLIGYLVLREINKKEQLEANG